MSPVLNDSRATEFADITLRLHNSMQSGQLLLLTFMCEPLFTSDGRVVAYRIHICGFDGRVIDQFDVSPEDVALYREMK